MTLTPREKTLIISALYSDKNRYETIIEESKSELKTLEKHITEIEKLINKINVTE